MRQYARDCPEELLRLAQEQASLAEQARRSEEELSRLRRENAQLHNKLATERQDGKDKLATCERKRTQLLEASGPYVQGLERSLADLTEQNRSLKQALQDRCNGSPPPFSKPGLMPSDPAIIPPSFIGEDRARELSWSGYL
ncbi:MAG TPA: hypothetical protein VNA24_31360, partial [Hyalangium sp.]|nr:hypothetical protein [Hyalangium sp.]